jgi:hypothetical protein
VGTVAKALFEATENFKFLLRRKLPDDNVPEEMRDDMLSDDNIRDFIRSRDDLSAC